MSSIAKFHPTAAIKVAEGEVFLRRIRGFARWLGRGRSYRLLLSLDDHMLRDIGLTRADIHRMALEGSEPLRRP